jgi:hypothetical protein
MLTTVFGLRDHCSFRPHFGHRSGRSDASSSNAADSPAAMIPQLAASPTVVATDSRSLKFVTPNGTFGPSSGQISLSLFSIAANTRSRRAAFAEMADDTVGQSFLYAPIQVLSAFRPPHLQPT